ncbi:MAG: PAS domain S-box protein [Ignavibacteriales bacterium]|nr:PAS domain S-box protein [Ignavibacteriales bacterium]
MKKISKWQIFLISITAIIFLSAAAIYYYYTETKEIRKEKYEYLNVIAKLKIDQISKWRNERLSEAEFFPTVGRFIKSTVFLSENPNDEEAKNFLMQTLDPIKQRHNYKNLLITDLNNRILFSIEPEEKKLDSIAISYSKISVEMDSIIFTDFYYCETHSKTHLDIISPIKDNDARIIGTFILRFDPTVFLFPLIQDWPTPTKTAESIIFKKENDQVRFISELKYENNSEMNFTIPLTKTEYVAVKGALGRTGIVEGLDYRNVEVLADLNKIPGTAWHFISKVDKDEIYSEMFFRARAISLLTIVSFLFVMAMAMYLIRNKQTSIYKNLFIREKELSETKEEFRTTLYSIGDAVITTDSKGFIKYMNSVAEQLTGWRESEASGKMLNNVFKIINEDTNIAVEDPVSKVLKNGSIVGLANHTMLIRKDDTQIPISDSGSPIKDDNHKIIGVVLVFRDQSEERKKEKTLLESEEKFRKMTLSSPMGMHFYELKNNNDLVLIDSNPAADRLLGIDHKTILGKTIEQAFPPLAYTEVPQRYREAASNGILWATEQIAYKDDKIEGAFEVKAYQTKPYNMVAVFTDITERKRFEESLKSSEEKYRMLLDFASDAFFQGDSNGNFIYINNKAIDLTGYSREELLKMNIKDLFSKELLETSPLRYDKLLAGETIKTERAVVKKNGTSVYVEISSKQMPDGTYQSFMRDITEIKKSEKELAVAQERFKKAFTTSPDSININRFSDGVYVSINNGFTKMTGYTEEEVVGKTSAQIQIWADIKYRNELVEKLKTTNVVDNFEAKFRMKDGNIKDGLMSAAVIELNGNPHIISITRDISERKIAEEIIKSSEANLNSLINNRNESIWSIDKDYNYIVFNNYFAETYFAAYNQKLVKGINALTILTPELKAFWKPKYDLALSGKKTEFEFTYQLNNKFIYLQVFLNPIIADGIINGVSALSVDTTEQKHAEESLKASERKLRQVIDLVPHFIFAKNIDGKFILANKAIADVYGTTAENMINKCDYDFNPNAEEVRHFIEDDKKVIESGVELSSFEETITDSKGATRYLKTTKIPFTASGINEPALLGISVDITEQKRADAVLQDIIDKNPMSIQILDLEGYTIQTNLAHTKLFSVKPPANYSMFSDAQLLKLGYQEVFENFKKGEIVYFTDTYYNVHNVDPSFPDRPIWIKAVGFPLNDIHGKPEYYVLMHENITERKLAEEALKKTKIHYQKLIENAPDGIVQISLEGRFKYVSPSAKRIFGYPLDLRVEAQPDNLTHPEDLPLVLSTLNKIINDPSLIQTIQYRFKHTNNSWIWIESTFTNLLNEPSVDAIVINFRDITERRKMEEAVQHSETKFYSLFENSPNAIFITDPETLIIIDCNANACSMNGYKREELIGKSINILHPQNVSEQLNNSELHQDQIEILRKHKSVTVESVHKRKDGTVFPIESSISLISLSGKEVTMGIDRDITDRKKLLTEIIGSEEKFRSIWENSVDAMRLVDRNGVIINVNDSYCNLFGLKKEDLIGNLFSVSYTITESDTSLKGFKERFKNGTILKKFETEIQLKNGKAIWVELTNSFIEFEDKAAMLLSIIRDITDRKVLITELTDAKEKAEEMIRLKSYFFANMSHELRTPFVGILGFAEILKDTLQNADEREYAEQILKSSKRLTDTLNKILNVTRLEFDKVDLKYREFDVCILLKSIEAFYHNSAKLNNTTINTVLENESIVIKSDAKLLEDILNNLVNNAVKFTRDGSITLSAQKTILNNKDYLTIKVEDTGIGIPKEKQHLVWQEFRQASEGLNRSFEGTGLGLTITKKYVEILGGEISLESEENIGTVFTINIPADHHQKIESEVFDKIPDQIKPTIEKSKNRRHKILYVEDDLVALQFINIILKSIYDVETAFKATAALELVKKVQYDVLMLDINLGSGMDGVELMQKIRQMDHYKNIPIVAVTAYAAQSDKVEFLAKGFTHYISKPFTKNELFSLLKGIF